MPLQSRLTNFTSKYTQLRNRFQNIPAKPNDEELSTLIAPNHLYDFDVEALDNIDRFRRRIRDAEYATDPIEAWSHILGDYLSYGNTKIESSVAIFNMGAATDCVNLNTQFCQVDPDECYAVVSETEFPKPRQYRRKQQLIWEHLDAVTWAEAFRRHYERKETPVTAIRFSESGDFSSQHDILKVNEIARQLTDIVDIFTYSASSWLDWSEATHFTVNQSNNMGNFGDRRYVVVESPAEIPSDGVWCPYDQTDGNIKCGECRVCLDTKAPDVYIEFENLAKGPGAPKEETPSDQNQPRSPVETNDEKPVFQDIPSIDASAELSE